MSEELPIYDHRRVGRELNLFHVQEDAAGSVFWHPRGYTLFRVVENYIRDRLTQEGYDEVRTPQIVSSELWKKSGHWEKFRKNMFIATDADADAAAMTDPKWAAPDQHVFGLKPMNCPCHVQIFNIGSISYRDLPMRMAEFGICHRNEPSGSLHGIMRVRQFTQDDAHIFCTEDQVASETKKFCDLLMSVYRDFGFTEVEVALSTRPDLRAGDDETWDRAEAALATAVEAAGLTAKLQPGEGAFYGPKLEFALTDLRGRVWQCGTLQLDFVLPSALDAQFTDRDGARKPPVMLHRAILGSLERFIGILIEHNEGRLPAWITPVQYVVLPLKPEQAEYAASVHESLALAGLRGHVDARDDNLNNKIKDHLTHRVPFLIVVGGREKDNYTVALRENGGSNQTVPLDELPLRLQKVCRRPTMNDTKV
ncbi:MAG: threonine--tRNA ligase [Verrucomicrobiaceae bacterium]|nr:MAG: threonine--tRNA ligase [Verrucomicrobiaceae bacterium]